MSLSRLAGADFRVHAIQFRIADIVRLLQRGSPTCVERVTGSVANSGAQGRNRTTDTVIFSHVLYQLSYLGPRPAPVGAASEGGL